MVWGWGPKPDCAFKDTRERSFRAVSVNRYGRNLTGRGAEPGEGRVFKESPFFFFKGGGYYKDKLV